MVDRAPDATSLAFRHAMGDPPRATPAAAFAAARQRIRAGEKLDMVALAAELGVARATVYRWSGDRDQLLADVVVAELQDLIGFANARADGEGVRRLEGAVELFLDLLAGLPSLRSFLRNEGEGGLRMLTAPRGPVRPRVVATVAEIIDGEVRAGRYRPPASPELLADAVITLAERFLHNGGDPELNPDPATARTSVALLLREPCVEPGNNA
jgi:AcrR family transcriptional regulator